MDPSITFPPESQHEIILSSDNSAVSYLEFNTVSVVEYILRKAKENVQNGDKAWLTNCVTGECLTLAQLEPLSRSVASAMSKRGMQKGDVAIYITSDVTRIYAIMIGVWRLGGIMHSSYAEDSIDERVQLIKHSKPRWIFCDPNSASQCKLAVAKINYPVELFIFGEAESTVSVDELFLDDGTDCPDEVPNPDIDDPVLILCTSGTTGRSKGVVYTNKSMLGCLISPNKTRNLHELGKPVMLLNGCVHGTGATIPILSACNGSAVVMVSQISTESILNGIHKYKPYKILGFPTFLLNLTSDNDATKFNLSSLEEVVVVGEVITEPFYNSMSTLPNMKRVINAYGLTECGGVASTSYSKTQNIRKISVGRLLPHIELKVIDLETGLTLGPNQRGELVVRGPSMPSSYWNLPEESALTFVNGWVKTGDFGYYDEEGYIFVVNRIADVFKCCGKYIFPSELEGRILEHPAVASAIVFRVQRTNCEGYFPRALVVLKPGTAEVTAREIREFAKVKLSDYQQIRGGLYIVDSIPVRTVGKISKSEAANVAFHLSN